MANEEHLRILRQGVDAWNQWRRDHRNAWPDLTRASLTHASLFGASLTGADFTRADLFGADLRDADLLEASLTRADLTGAHLLEADLTRADLTGAHLLEADLTRADLTDANLTEADLTEADLTRANLFGADLFGADLFGADLFGADLFGTDLTGTDLTGANLTRANLTRADLTDANLSDADLRLANLTVANLTRANLVGAHLFRTVLGDTDLSITKGLDTCSHGGPSIIDHQTLTKSGRLPLVFLRGCGLPDLFIDHIPALFLDNPIEFYSCFISYASPDQAFAERLYADLQNKGVRCWFAPEDMKIGDPVRTTVDTAIRLRDKLVLILSDASMASDWVEHEVRQALAEEARRGALVLFPLRIDETVMQVEFGWAKRLREAHTPTGRHIGNFTQWKDHDAYQQAFARLLRDLRRAEGPDPS